MRTPNVGEFKQWCKIHAPLALAVVSAQAFAAVEKERVDAYILPIFRTFTFHDELGNMIKDPEHLYRSKEEALCAAYDEQCDMAHRIHGFDGPHGNCPALRAEGLRREAEGILVKSGCGLVEVDYENLYGDKYDKFLELLMGACIKAALEHGLIQCAE